MKRMENFRAFLILGLVIVLFIPEINIAQVQHGKTSFELFGGGANLIGDIQEPDFNTYFSFALFRNLHRNLEIFGRAGYDMFTGNPITNSNPEMEITNLDAKEFAFDAGLRFTVKETAGYRIFTSMAGGINSFKWTADYGSELSNYKYNPLAVRESGTDSHVAFEWGLEKYAGSSLGIEFKVTYKYLMHDDIDAINYHRDPEGDRNDGQLGFGIGLKIYPGSEKDSDADKILDKADFSPYLKEDIDGVMDNDGKPDLDNDFDGIPDSLDANPNVSDKSGADNPVVVHEMITSAKKNTDLLVTCSVENNKSLKKVAIVFRVIGKNEWNARTMKRVKGTRYATLIPGTYIGNSGLEYFIVAIDKSLTKIGTFGTLRNPVRINMGSSSSKWKVPGFLVGIATGAISSYLILDKQYSN